MLFFLSLDCVWLPTVFQARDNTSRRIALQPSEHRVHVPGTPREPINGSHKFKYLTAAGDTSCSRYDEGTVHTLSKKRMSNGRKMGVPHSVMCRSEDNLWLHHREVCISSIAALHVFVSDQHAEPVDI